MVGAVSRRRRHFAEAAAADRNWSARRRPHVGVTSAPFSWRVHVMLYTSYMLLDFCNAVYSEARTLTKSSKNDVGVFCNSPWYSNETRQRQSKSVFWTISWKWYLMLKVSYGTSLEIWLIKRIYTACTVITAHKIKAYKYIVSTKNLSQHFECLVKCGQLPVLCSSVSTLGRLKTREWKTRDGGKETLPCNKGTYLSW